ncbi:MAG: protein kinase [Kofleriaceae bacterium]
MATAPGGQAAEQIIAGVVLSERLAVTMYGAVHRAQFNGQRNLRGLIVDPKMLAEDSFRGTLTDTHVIESVTALAHPNTVPTFTVESGGPDVVIVTRGVGRFVTVQDLITASRARKGGGGKLPTPVAGLIAKSVIEALAAAHQAGVIHGAVHPRSVLITDEGQVQLGDFVVGRALTTAVAQGADSSLWRGLTGYVAPELVVGEEPTPGSDVYAVGAMLFTMLSGDPPPGSLRSTPAVERLVQRATDTDPKRRYKTATDLLENFIEAMEDDRWELADRGELIKEAGLSQTDTNIDDATEDLLASLGSPAMQVTPTRPSMDMRAEQVVARQSSPGVANTTGRLDALLTDLASDHTSVTNIDDTPYRRDPISELISLDPRKREAIVQSTSRVPSLDDPDDDPPAQRPARAQSQPAMTRPSSSDEAAAFAAIGELDEGARRINSVGDQAAIAAMKLEEAAARAERAAQKLETGQGKAVAKPKSVPAVVLPDPMPEVDASQMRVKSRSGTIIGILVLAIAGGAIYMIVRNFDKQDQANDEAKKQHLIDEENAAKKQHDLIEALPDPGTINVTSTPPQAGVWLKLGTGRTPIDSIPLGSEMMHEIRLEGVDGYDPIDAQVMAANWTAPDPKDKHRSASITVAMTKSGKDGPAKLPAMPPKPPEGGTFTPGRGIIHIDSTPKGAEVWMYIGMTNNVALSGIQAGQPYELRVLADGYLPGYISVTPDEWRQNPNDKTPIDSAKKKSSLDKDVQLVADPNAAKGSGAGSGTGSAADKKEHHHHHH